MLYFEPWKKILIAVICGFGLLATTPNFFYETAQRAGDARAEIAKAEQAGRTPSPETLAAAESWPSFLPSGVVNLGLDLQGGAHFLLEVRAEQVVARRIKSVRDNIGPTLREAGVRRYVPNVQADGTATVLITNVEDVAAAGDALRDLAEPVAVDFFGTTQPDLTVTLLDDGQTYQLQFTDEARVAMTDAAVAAAIEVLRTRVDALGTREPTIVRQGENRILLQLPGASEVDIESLLKPSRLDFHRVAEGGGVGAGPTMELTYDEELNPDFAGRALRVFRKIEITGDNLAEAQQGFDGDTGEVGVTIRFDAAGARVFRRLSANVGERFAMVLDGKILSAPVFRVQIVDGRAIITGDFTVESAQALAINLNSGSLPAEVTVEESSFVGPELGADSIAAGRIAAIVGFIGVLVYMALSYGLFGILANVALVLNVALIFGALSLLGATLTLPGIAGIVLTIGMAVDANVLVFERIREELANGRKVASSIETGYQRALSAIIDANVTTFIAAAILFILGSGPVRGFAVTLAIGIITSVFTAVMLTRFFVSSWYGWRRPKTLEL